MRIRTHHAAGQEALVVSHNNLDTWSLSWQTALDVGRVREPKG